MKLSAAARRRLLVGGLVAIGIAVLAVVALVLSSSGFTASTFWGSATSSPTPSASSTQSVPAPEISSPPFVGVQGPIPDAATINGDPDLRNHVTMTGCTQTANGWQGTGTAKNVSTADLTYKIVVIFTDAQARAITSAATTVTVAAGATGTWTAGTDFGAPAGVQCVLAGVDTAK
jgi:hypothetical protein